MRRCAEHNVPHVLIAGFCWGCPVCHRETLRRAGLKRIQRERVDRALAKR